MSDHNKFFAQMNDMFTTLEATVIKTDLPISKKDAIIGLARELRHAAYQAGRTEAQHEDSKPRLVEDPSLRGWA